jgi:hypothetical protein
MAELHVIAALRNKRAELSGMVCQLEQQLVQQRANLSHLDATMRLFDPGIQPSEIRAKQQRTRSAWFRPGKCLRLIYEELRDSSEPMTTRELAKRIIGPPKRRPRIRGRQCTHRRLGDRLVIAHSIRN